MGMEPDSASIRKEMEQLAPTQAQLKSMMLKHVI